MVTPKGVSSDKGYFHCVTSGDFQDDSFVRKPCHNGYINKSSIQYVTAGYY